MDADARGTSVEIGGITIVARRSDAWDAIVALFDHLGGEHPRSRCARAAGS